MGLGVPSATWQIVTSHFLRQSTCEFAFHKTRATLVVAVSSRIHLEVWSDGDLIKKNAFLIFPGGSAEFDLGRSSEVAMRLPIRGRSTDQDTR